MRYYLRLMNWCRWPQPTYRPLGPSTPLTSYPTFQQGWVYRFPLAGQVQAQFSWPEYIIIHPLRRRLIEDPNQPNQVATLVEVFMVLHSEYEEFVEPIDDWELK